MRIRVVLVFVLTGGFGLGGFGARPAAAELYTPEEVVTAAVPALDLYWGEVFAANGVPYASPNNILWYNTATAPGPTMTRACGVAPVSNAVYCTGDATVYLDYTFFWQLLEEYGDFALAMIVAHEWAHHIERLLGFSPLADGVIDQPGEIFSIQMELLADCWAGSATSYMESLGMLEEGDLEEGYDAVLEMGDEHFGGVESPLQSGAHGTSDQRLDAFFGGYDLADPGSCPTLIDEILAEPS